MTILVVDTCPHMGGAEWSLLELTERFIKNGVNVVAAMPEGDLATKMRSINVATFTVPQIRLKKSAFLRTSAAFIAAAAKIPSVVYKSGADVILANNLAAGLLAAISPVRRPLVWHIRDLRLPHHCARWLAPRAKRIIAASRAIDETLCEMLPRQTIGRVRLVPNGIDTNRFSMRDRIEARRILNLPHHVPIVGMLANLVPWKKHDLFIESMALVKQKCRDARFIIAGQDLFNEHGKWIARLHDQANGLHLGNDLIWLDKVNDSTSILGALNVLLHPAYDEPFGRVLCEAMAMQIPVIAIDRAGPSSIIKDGITGFLVPPRNPEQLAYKTIQLLHNPAMAKNMGENGRAHVLQSFNADRTAKHVLQVCHEALQTQHASGHA